MENEILALKRRWLSGNKTTGCGCFQATGRGLPPGAWSLTEAGEDKGRVRAWQGVWAEAGGPPSHPITGPAPHDCCRPACGRGRWGAPQAKSGLTLAPLQRRQKPSQRVIRRPLTCSLCQAPTWVLRKKNQ